MRNVTNILLTMLFALSVRYVFAGQQTPPASQAQGSGSAAVLHIVTGCLVGNGHDYSLMTESSSYPIETEESLAQYANKQITVTGILDHHTNTTPSTSRNATIITDLRLKMIALVIGDCNRPSN